MLVDSLKGHEGIKIILEKLTGDLDGMDEVLKTASSDELSDKQRDRIIDRKRLYQWFIGFFKDPEAEMQSLDKIINEEEEFVKTNS